MCVESDLVYAAKCINKLMCLKMLTLKQAINPYFLASSHFQRKNQGHLRYSFYTRLFRLALLNLFCKFKG